MTERRVKLEQHLQLLLLDLEVTKVFDWFAQVSSHTTCRCVLSSYLALALFVGSRIVMSSSC